MKIGDNIKRFRIDKGIKQKDFAKMLDIPVSTLANYEINNREPNIETLNKIAKALDIDVGMLLLFTDKPFKMNKEGNDIKIETFESNKDMDIDKVLGYYAQYKTLSSDSKKLLRGDLDNYIEFLLYKYSK